MVEEHIIQLFKHNFLEKKCDREIVIYGIGEWTRFLLDAYPSAPIYGLLDGYLDEGGFCGKKIIAIETLKGKNVKIVIVARKASELIIFKRISDICREYDIPVFNLEGIQLNSQNEPESLPEERDMDSLYGELSQFECVSFDIFDTLLIRKTIFRESVYQLINKLEHPNFDFCSMRLHAERKLQEEKGEPTLDDIYEFIREETGILPESARSLQELEIRLELEYLIQRRETVNLYNRLLGLGKTIYLITDMYFPGNLIENILDRNGIRGYAGLLVSCECKMGKRNGLFHYYNCLYPYSRKAHVGDSWEADSHAAEQAGIEPFLIPSVMDMVLQKNAKSILLNYDGSYMEYIRSLSFSHMFDSKKIVSSRIWIQSAYQLGFCLIAPILYGWAKWIYEYAIDNHIQKILFVSRDGYLVEKLFQKICSFNKKKIETEYLIFSRSLGWQATVYSEEDLNELLALPFSGNVGEWLSQRFGIKTEDKRKFLGNERAVFQYKDAILEKSGQVRRQYQSYWEKHDLGKDRMTFVDFVSAGTCQRRLERLTSLKLDGLYFEALPHETGSFHAEDYVHTLWQDVPPYNYFFLELLIKEPVGSVKSMDHGAFVYGKNHMEKDGLKIIQKVHEAVLDFAEQYLSGQLLAQEREDVSQFVKTALELINGRYLAMDLALWENLSGHDEFTNRPIPFSL